MGDPSWVYLVAVSPSHIDQLSLAMGRRSGTGYGFNHHKGRNSEFSVTVGPVTRIVGQIG